MIRRRTILSGVVAALVAIPAIASGATRSITAEALRDKVRGGLLGQVLGNLNGLSHEMEYIDEPGEVQSYVPALPKGAWTDDDTDFEWVYIVEMQRANEIYLPPERIAQLWRERINRRIWCSNRYARYLMDLGLAPPLTGNVALNPWAAFNISGQFLAETFGLLAPGMPRTASRIGLNYTRVAIDYEPAQTTQFFDTMIAMAFFESDVDKLLDHGVNALDPRSKIREIVADARRWHLEHPDDWRATRLALKQKYSHHGGGMRDRNGYELNTGSTVAALLYGAGDFQRTLITAFNFGWDCDNTAATAGTIIGVTKGYRWMLSQGWQIVDRYENRTRDQMPLDETLTSFADRLVELAEKVVVAEGGRRVIHHGRPVFEIQAEDPAPVVELRTPDEATAELLAQLRPRIESAFTQGSRTELAQAAYLAIALDLHAELKQSDAGRWDEALDALGKQWRVVQNIYWDAEIPRVLPLRQRALAAGLEKPKEKRDVW